MSRKKKEEMVSPSKKLEIAKEYINGHISYLKLGRKYDVDESSIRKWVAKYQTFGEEAFTKHTANLCYTAEFKKKVVEAYLNGEGSYKDIAIKYKIHASSTVLKWVKQYNNHEELTDSRPEGVFQMVKNNIAKKTTLEERITIVEHCIANANNYALTAQKYKCSYGQVYSWVNKYSEKGVEGLYDRRGKNKSTEELNENEKLKAEIRILKAQSKQQQMEIDFLKKLEAIERR